MKVNVYLFPTFSKYLQISLTQTGLEQVKVLYMMTAFPLLGELYL